MATKKKGMSGGEMAAIGAGAVALGATAFYFLGPKGKQHQKSAKKWTIDAKKKIIQEIKKGKQMTEALYGDIVDNVVEPYIAQGATAAEVIEFAKALKRDWKHIVKASKADVKNVVVRAKGRVVSRAKKALKKKEIGKAK